MSRLSRNEMIDYLGLELEWVEGSSLQLDTAMELQESYPLDKYNMILSCDYDIRYKLYNTHIEICRKNGVVVYIIKL